MKRLVLLAEGDWASPGALAWQQNTVPTSVQKLQAMLLPSDPVEGVAQQTYTCPSTPSFATDLQQAYRYIITHYQPGDELYLFGQGRGAFLLYVLADFIGTVGAVSDEKEWPALYATYRALVEQHGLEAVAHRRIPVHFLGTWEMTAPPRWSVLRTLQKSIERRPPRGRVDYAYQALALDQDAAAYPLALWQHSLGQLQCQTTWFSGSHRNISGTATDRRLSDVALVWMVNRARAAGLQVSLSYLHNPDLVKPTLNGSIEVHRTVLQQAVRLAGIHHALRSVGNVVGGEEMVHESVLERVLNDTQYRPANLFPNVRNVYPLAIAAQNHRMLVTADARLAIFRERQIERFPLTECFGTLQDSSGAVHGCQILDYSINGGAKLRVQQQLRPGALALLNSLRFGLLHVKVVWLGGEYVGVRFAA